MLWRVYRTALRGFADFSEHPSLSSIGIVNFNICRNYTIPELYEDALKASLPHVVRYTLTNTGALAAFPGPMPARPPGHKRIVSEESSTDLVWWGPANVPVSRYSYYLNLSRALDFMNFHERLYVVDGYAGWDPKSRISVRVICSEVHNAIFATMMLIRPSEEELLRDFEGPTELVILAAGRFPAKAHTTGVKTAATLDIHLGDRKLLIMGIQHSIEIKRGLFAALHYFLPKKGLIPLHCSATIGKSGDTSLMFGLRGSGKTTLSHGRERMNIGDDECCWGEDGISSLEGGGIETITRNHMKEAMRLSHFGSLLENVAVDSQTRETSYGDEAYVVFPDTGLPNALIPGIGGHPKNVIFLVKDTFGVFPPVCKMSLHQAIYHYIAGFNGDVESGEPVAVFSACFAKPFLVLSPEVYADILATKIKDHGTKCWLVNSGWARGKAGVGKRMSLETTRSVLKAIHRGALDHVRTRRMYFFELEVPIVVPGIDPQLMEPRKTWANPVEYDSTLKSLALMFRKQTRRYEDLISPEITAAGPRFPCNLLPK